MPGSPGLNWVSQKRIPTVIELDPYDQSPCWKTAETPLGDGNIPAFEHPSKSRELPALDATKKDLGTTAQKPMLSTILGVKNPP